MATRPSSMDSFICHYGTSHDKYVNSTFGKGGAKPSSTFTKSCNEVRAKPKILLLPKVVTK
jgi:hypothetical protein